MYCILMNVSMYKKYIMEILMRLDPHFAEIRNFQLFIKKT